MGRNESELSAGGNAELRRGVLLLAVLLHLNEPHYGYSLRRALVLNGFRVEEGTLYPLLRRCEERGFLVSEWRDQDGRERRYYILTGVGTKFVQALLAEWRVLVKALDGCIVDLSERGLG